MPTRSAASQFNKARAIVVMAKDIHPKWHSESKVVCNGEEVLVTSGTKPEYIGERTAWAADRVDACRV